MENNGQSLWNQTKDKYGCKCLVTELRYLLIEQPGRKPHKQFKYQCMTCGKTSSAIGHAKLTPEQRRDAKEVDREISKRYWDNEGNKVKQEYTKAKAHEKENFFDLHSAYLRSPKWQAKRQAVLRRDGYVCQACLKNPAKQAHHLTYKHWGHEPLFELIAVCVPCHEALTDLDRSIRDGNKCQPAIEDLEVNSLFYLEIEP